MITVAHRYAPRGTAKQLLHCRDPEVLLSGPAGTGKSRACLEKMHLMALLNPEFRGLMVRKTAVSLTSSGLVTFREHVAKQHIAAGDVVWYGGSQQEPPGYRYTNGSIINVGGMDKPTKIMSTEYDCVYVQEAIELTLTDWESITTRLRNGKVRFQQLLADTNPDVDTHWLNVRANRGDTLMMESRHEDNPVYFDDDGNMTQAGRDYIEGKLDKLTGVRYLRLRKGLWVAAEGMIFENWDAAHHLVNRYPIPDSWPRFWSVDFGYRHPFVLQCWAEDPDGRLVLYREIYRTGRLVEDHVRDILLAVTKVVRDVPERQVVTAKDIREDIAQGRREWIEPKPRAIVRDHDAEDAATLERHLGMSTVAAKKAVSEGIQAVEARLRVAGDGKPGLTIMRDSVVERDQALVDAAQPTCTAEEVPGYVWDTSNGKKLKEQPLKERDDGCDAMRYLVAERDLGARPRIRWM